MLQTVLGDGHTGYAHVSLAGIHCGDDGIERHIVDDKLLAENVAHGGHHVDVETDDLALFLELIRSKLGVSSHDKLAVVCDALGAFVGVLAVLVVNEPVLLDEGQRAVFAEL